MNIYGGAAATVFMRFCILILFICALTFSAYGQGGPGSREKGRGKLGELKLTAEQNGRLKEIRKKYEGRREDILCQMKVKKVEMIKLLRDEKPDRNKIEKKLDEITKLEAERQRLFLDEYFDVREVLTPEQVKIFTRITVRHLMRD